MLKWAVMISFNTPDVALVCRAVFTCWPRAGELCDTLHDCAKHWRDKFKWGAQLPSWREVATPEQIQKHDSMKPTTNNYVTERINE